MNPKILLAAPINVVKSYCLFDWLKLIKELDYDNYDIFLVDNSPDPAFSQKIRDLGFNCVHEPPAGRETRYLLLASSERCRIKFLAGDYTHFFSLECDIFPPKDIIQKLVAHEKDVVGTTYWTFHGYDSQLQLLNIYNFHTDFVNYKKEFKNRYLSLEEGLLFMDGQCKLIYANGIGCILIKRWVLENIPFRIDPTDSGHPDSFFHQDLWRNGIENYVDTSIIPLHRNSNWNTILGDFGHKKLAISKGTMELQKPDIAKFIIIGEGNMALKAQAKLLAQKIESVIMTAQEIKEQHLELSSRAMIKAEAILKEPKHYIEPFKRPLTRAERRKLKRKK